MLQASPFALYIATVTRSAVSLLPIAQYTKALQYGQGTWVNPIASKTACDDFDYVTCDSQGNIVDLQLAMHAFSGPLPDSIQNLPLLEKLRLGSNQFTGQLHSSIFASPYLKEASFFKNQFTGEVPCMNHSEPELNYISISYNHFTGGLKPCLFTDAPKLEQLYLNYVELDTAIPPEIKEATELKQMQAMHAGIHGALPLDLMCMSKLFELSLPRNKLSGSIPQIVLNGWKKIYRLNLDDNQLSGQLPMLDWHTPVSVMA